MKLSTMGYKDVRCVFYYLDGKVKMAYQQNKIAKLIEGRKDIVIMKNPTIDQQVAILSKINENNGKLEMKGSSVLECIKLVTNIELDVDEKQALELIANPDEMLEQVALECDILILEIVKKQLKQTEAMANVPESFKIAVVEGGDTPTREEIKRKQEAQRILDELKALEEKLKEIQG